jgi:hypothetical protein
VKGILEKFKTYTACLTNPVRQPSLDISPLAQRKSIGRDDYSLVSIMFLSRVFSFHSTDAASGRHKMISQNCLLFSCIGFQRICFLVRLLHEMFLSSPFDKARSHVLYIAVVILMFAIQWLRLTLSEGTKNVGVELYTIVRTLQNQCKYE